MFLLPENVARQNGAGAEFALDAARGKPLLLTLGITRIVEQESLEVSIWGSSDQRELEAARRIPAKVLLRDLFAWLLDLDRRSRDPLPAGGVENEPLGLRPSRAPLFGFYSVAEEPKFHSGAWRGVEQLTGDL